MIYIYKTTIEITLINKKHVINQNLIGLKTIDGCDELTN